MNEASVESTRTWLPLREVIGPIARHLGYAVEHARLRIIRYVKARRIRMRGRTSEEWMVYATGHGAIDWTAESLELCLEELIEANLLPAPGEPEGPERAWQSADRAVAYIITGFLVEWGDWIPEMIREKERGEIKLGEAALDGLPTQGQKSPQGPTEHIPRNAYRPEMIEMKAIPAGPWPSVGITVLGTLAIYPPHRGSYKGPRWELIEADWAELRQRFSNSLRARQPATPAEPPQAEAALAREPPAEDAERQRLLRLPEEEQFEEPRKWRPDEVQTWFASAKNIHPRKPGENKSEYARRLHHEHMKNDFVGGVISWDVTTLRRRLND